MPIYRPTPIVPNRPTATMHAFARPAFAAPAPQPPAPPSPQLANAPNAPVLAVGTSGTLTVSWPFPSFDSTHDAATGFNLQFSPSGAATWTVVPGVSSPYSLAGLTAATAYDVQIQSVNAAGASAFSPASTLTTAPASPYAPSIPAAPTLAAGASSGLVVTWAPAAGAGTPGAATSYNLRTSPSGAGAWTTVAGVTSPYTVAGLTAATAYDVELQSANSAGTSLWSAASTLTTAAAAPTIPNTPATPSLAQGSGSNLTVTWTAPAADGTHSAATGFNLRSSPSGAGTWTAVTGVTSPYTLSGLTAGSAYDVQVQGTNAAGTSAWSVTATLTTASTGTGPYAPNAPAITGVTPPPNGTASQLTVTWTAPATDSTHGAATGYNLRTSPSGAGTWTTVTGVSSPFTLTGLAGATSIDVEVQATNAASTPSAWSAITTGKTWGATVAPGTWVAAASQVHGTSVAPNGGVQAVAVPAPTAVTGFVFAWSASPSTFPTTSLIVANGDGQANGWGQYFSAPATAGTFYLWMVAQGSGGATIGAYVTPAITVT